MAWKMNLNLLIVLLFIFIYTCRASNQYKTLETGGGEEGGASSKVGNEKPETVIDLESLKEDENQAGQHNLGSQQNFESNNGDELPDGNNGGRTNLEYYGLLRRSLQRIDGELARCARSEVFTWFLIALAMTTILMQWLFMLLNIGHG